MKKITISIVALAAAIAAASCSPQQEQYDSRAEKILAELHNPSSDNVLVISHRGDWRNYPENSIPAIESVIEMGVDIVEIDLKLTKDSVLVLCHDKTIDRTTSGKGKVSDFTLDSLKTFVLKRAHGCKTDSLRMPTLEEALAVCKDRILVNVDHGYDYYDLVLEVTEKLGVTGQVLIKGKKTVAEVAEKFAEHQNNLLYMPIIDINKTQGKALFQEYMDTKTVPLAYEVCWSEVTDDVRSCMEYVVSSGSKLWTNTLWSSLCGGLDDDTAFEGNVDRVYGAILDMGVTMIQTDRPEMLIGYLRSRNLHD